MIDARRRDVLKAGLAGASALPFASVTGIAMAAPSLPGMSAELERVFHAPPRDAKPGIFWYWMYGNVTRAGITADLEGFAEAGIGTVLLFSILQEGENTLVKPAANALTPLWWSMVEFAIAEAGRLGLEMVMNACDGWATAGGKWITPELSMQMLVWSEEAIDGGAPYRGRLRQPETRSDYYRDLRLVAIPRPAEWDQTSVTRKVTVGGSVPVQDAAKLLDPANPTLEVDTDKAGDILFAFDAPFLLRSLTVAEPPHKKNGFNLQRAMNSLIVEASDDGRTYRHVTTLAYPRNGWETDIPSLTHPIPETRARFFRLVYQPSEAGPLRQDMMFAGNARLRLASVLLSGRPALQGLPVKNSQEWGKAPRTTTAECPDAACVDPARIVDLTDRLRPDGSLDWTPPAGRWTLLRIGYTTTGLENGPGGAGAGLECDKLSKQAARAQFDGWFKLALDRIGRDKALRVFHVDSWEARSQNWSPGLPEEFRRLRGYDLLPLLPILAGIPVASADHSERFLFDWRGTLSELTNENFFGEMSRLAHENGCRFEGEVPNPTYPLDGLDYGRFVDIPMGEFWLRTPDNYKPQDIKEAVSAAHVYGRTIAGSEAYTELRIKWDETPRMLKPLGDHHFAEGINRLYLHVSAMQPWTDRLPGMTLMGVGTFFGRNQSWWPMAGAWLSYLARSQALLQQGRPVVDVAMFLGEDIPLRAALPEDLPVALPPGYQYDSINRDALMRTGRVENGRLVLDGGMRYAALLLPNGDRMSPDLAERLADFAQAGLAIVGTAPEASVGARAPAEEDARVRAASVRMAPISATDTASLGRLLAARGTAPDLLADTPDIEWAHRSGEGWDLYFITNQAVAPVTVGLSVRATGAVHSWNADRAEIIPLAARERDGRTDFSLELEPSGSRLIVVTSPSEGDVTTISGEGAALSLQSGPTLLAEGRGRWSVTRRSGEIRRVSAGEVPNLPVTGAWRVRFGKDIPDAAMTRLQSWTSLAPERQRFFSGVASYSLDLPVDRQWLSRHLRWFLDLGEVRDLARIWLNGHEIATLWTPPFVAEVTDQMKPGVNRLRIDVANCWRNRLIGDSTKPQAERSTFVWPIVAATGPDWLPTLADGLLPSGLLGPVTLRAATAIGI